MHGLKGERTLMRIHIGESDKYMGKPLHRAIVELLRERQLAGATVLRGIAGFGASARIRTDRIEVLSLDLPIIIECVDTENNIASILPQLDEMIGGGLITLERAKVIMYRPATAADARAPGSGIEMTGSGERAEPNGGATH
jgi:PII-like signaling protein